MTRSIFITDGAMLNPRPKPAIPGGMARILSFERAARPDARALVAAGFKLEKAGKMDAALELYESNLAGPWPLREMAVNAGIIHYNRKKFTNAMACFEQALAIDHNYALGHYDIANCFEELGQPERAIEHYKEAVRLVPDYADAHFNLALCLKKECLSSFARPYKGEAIRHFNTFRQFESDRQWANLAQKHCTDLSEDSKMGLVRMGPAADASPNYEEFEEQMGGTSPPSEFSHCTKNY